MHVWQWLFLVYGLGVLITYIAVAPVWCEYSNWAYRLQTKQGSNDPKAARRRAKWLSAASLIGCAVMVASLNRSGYKMTVRGI